MNKNTRIYIVALLLFAAGMGFLMYSGLQEGTAYHIDVAEANAMKDRDLQGARVFGTVDEVIERAPDLLSVRFFLVDQNDSGIRMEVLYEGAVPDGFKPGAEIYATGNRAAGAREFSATVLNATCPSKYKKENRQ